MRTPKHIHDAVRNTLRSVGKDLTSPQARVVKEMLVGIRLRKNKLLVDCHSGIVQAMEEIIETYLFAFTSFLSTVAPASSPRERKTKPLQRSLFPRRVIRGLGEGDGGDGCF